MNPENEQAQAMRDAERTCGCCAFGMIHRPDQCAGLRATKTDLTRLKITLNARRIK